MWNLSALDADSTLVVGYKFELPDYNTNSRSDEPYKTVKREYLIITWISMIGTVGGTLGMFVGFSLIGTSEWLYGCIRSIVVRAKLGLRNKETASKEESKVLP